MRSIVLFSEQCDTKVQQAVRRERQLCRDYTALARERERKEKKRQGECLPKRVLYTLGMFVAV